jgi:uncharacterized protein (TIGR00251 family)
MAAPEYLSDTDGGALVRVRVTPRASRTEIGEPRGGSLIVRVSAPPAEGRANDSLCRLLAKAAGVSRGKVRVVSGEKGREKVVRIEGVAAAELSERLR